MPFNYDGNVTDDDVLGIDIKRYDAIKFLTGAYTGKRPWALVEVKDSVHQYAYDEDGNIRYEDSSAAYEGNGVQLFYEVYDGEIDTWLVQRMDYTLGNVLDKDLNPT